jgi:prevent-host-death family protein
MISTGISDLKNNVTHYLRQIEAGKRVAVTARGRVIVTR